MTAKTLICPHLVRQVPKQFSWVDHRLVRNRHIDTCSHPAAALYLFLVTVSDAQGLSYYSDPTIMQRLSMDFPILHKARQNLINSRLIAYQKPLCQVLDLAVSVPPIIPETEDRTVTEPLSVGQIFKQILEGSP